MREGDPVALTPKIFETLLLLLQNHGKIVEREQLIQAVWHDNIVEEGNINSTIYLLRKALGETPSGQSYIATVPRRGYRFITQVQEFCVPELSAKGLTPNTIAVLPFRDLNNSDCDSGYSLGLADALITQLSQCRKLTVRPTSAIRKYACLNADPIAAGTELGVLLVVECNFQRFGDLIRVTAQLIEVNEEVPLWAGTYDEQMADLFTIEDNFSRNIANDLIKELVEKSPASLVWPGSNVA